MEQDILISVIVPVYNVEEYLPRCVDSILTQPYQNLEIILVEDGTKDSSGMICDEYAAKDPRIRVIHKENGGLSSARNAGIDIARGEYFAFLDSDDWIEPDFYERMLALAKKYDTKLVCAGRYDVDSRTGKKTVGLCPPREEVISAGELVKRIFTWDNIDSAAWDKLYHRSLFAEIRYPVGKIVEDVPVTYRLVLLAERAAMCDKPLYNYYHRPGSITTASISDKTFHYTDHTAAVYADIREHHPELADYARYLRVRGIVYAMQSIDLTDAENQKTYAKRYRKERRELAKHIPFFLTSPLFMRKERLTNLVLASGAYRWLRKIYHAVK